MNTGIKVAVFAIAVFATLAILSFIGSAYAATPFDLSKAKTVKDLPPGYFPGVQDEQFIIAITPDGSVVSFDGSSLQLVDDKASFLITVMEPKNTVSKEGDKIFGTVFRQVIDCKENKSSIAFSMLLSEDGRILISKINPETPKDIEPGTSGATLEKLVCTPPDGTPYKAPAKQYPKGTVSI